MEKIYNAIMGLVVGDALGVPYEFRKRDTFNATDMVGGGTYGLPKGTWSDDSSMTLATMDSIYHKRGRIDHADMMLNFSRWLCDGTFTPYGRAFDVGNTTRKAIGKYLEKGSPYFCGGTDISDNGNGSLMRILPLAFMHLSSADIFAVSALTHAHSISQVACDIYVRVAESLIAGYPKEVALSNAGYGELGYIADLERDEVKSTGYVIDTLYAALWCFLTTDSYREAVLKAVNLGEDTDTVAAVCGGLAGIYYGVGGDKGIPDEWIDKIARRDWIAGLCDRFAKSLKMREED